MKKYIVILFSIMLVSCGSIILVTAEEGVKEMGPAESQGEVFKNVCRAAVADDEGVKKITYDQFIQIRTSGEDYVLLDVLSPESYKKGHIPGAISFPLLIMNEATASQLLDKGSNIIVYCGSFKCMASTKAAKTLQDLGYKVVDYKGGLQEWGEKGHILREA